MQEATRAVRRLLAFDPRRTHARVRLRRGLNALCGTQRLLGRCGYSGRRTCFLLRWRLWQGLDRGPCRQHIQRTDHGRSCRTDTGVGYKL